MHTGLGLHQEDRQNIESIYRHGYDETITFRLVMVYCEARLRGQAPDEAYFEGVLRFIGEQLVRQRVPRMLVKI